MSSKTTQIEAQDLIPGDVIVKNFHSGRQARKTVVSVWGSDQIHYEWVGPKGDEIFEGVARPAALLTVEAAEGDRR